MKSNEIKEFERKLEDLILRHEPIERRWMSFRDLISGFQNKNCSVNAIPKNVEMFMSDLQAIVNSSDLAFQIKEDLFKAAMVNHGQGGYIRKTLHKRTFPRAIRRPECKAFHAFINKTMTINDIDHKGPHDRRSPPRNTPNRSNVRLSNRKYAREECQKFHDKYGDIPPSLYDPKGPDDRNPLGTTIIDFDKFFGKKD